MDFPNITELTSREFFNLATYNLTEVLTDFVMKFRKKFPGTNFTQITLRDPNRMTDIADIHKKMVKKLDEAQWVSYAYMPFGRCFSYTIPQKLQELGVYKSPIYCIIISILVLRLWM